MRRKCSIRNQLCIFNPQIVESSLLLTLGKVYSGSPSLSISYSRCAQHSRSVSSLLNVVSTCRRLSRCLPLFRILFAKRLPINPRIITAERVSVLIHEIINIALYCHINPHLLAGVSFTQWYRYIFRCIFFSCLFLIIIYIFK